MQISNDDITTGLNDFHFPYVLSTDSRTPIDGAGAVVLSVVLKPYSPSAKNKKTAHDGLWPFATPIAPACPGRQISAASFTLFNWISRLLPGRGAAVEVVDFLIAPVNGFGGYPS